MSRNDLSRIFVSHVNTGYYRAPSSGTFLALTPYALDTSRLTGNSYSDRISA
jgi:hypothetical protein